MSDLEALLNEVRLLWHRMVQVGEELHKKEPVTLGMRGVLELLLLAGSVTVPQMARSRNVTRQHIQALVNKLRKRGLVRLGANPVHKRSALVFMTLEGERAISRMRAREAPVLAEAGRALGSAADIQRATATLKGVRRRLGGDNVST